MTDKPASLVERLLGGKCPRCKGWGEVAYFGEMVRCECGGNFVTPISLETRSEAAAALTAKDEQIARLEAERTAAVEAAYRKGLEDAAGVAESCSMFLTVGGTCGCHQIEARRTIAAAIRALATQDSRTTEKEQSQ